MHSLVAACHDHLSTFLSRPFPATLLVSRLPQVLSDSVGLSFLLSTSLLFCDPPTALCCDGVVRFVSVSPAGQDRVCFEIPCVMAGKLGGSFAMDRNCNQLALVADGKVSLLPSCQACAHDVGYLKAKEKAGAMISRSMTSENQLGLAAQARCG